MRVALLDGGSSEHQLGLYATHEVRPVMLVAGGYPRPFGGGGPFDGVVGAGRRIDHADAHPTLTSGFDDLPQRRDVVVPAVIQGHTAGFYSTAPVQGRAA